MTLADTTHPEPGLARGQAARGTRTEPVTDKLSLAIVAAVRPNIPKLWTLLRGLGKLVGSGDAVPKFEHTVVHTGQHYDDELGERFAQRFGVEVDINLGKGGVGGTRLPDLLADLEGCFDRLAPDLVFVIGDVNSTVAAAAAAARRKIPVVHVEAGLRSGGRDLEEVNRRLITASSVVHLASSRLALHNLLREGVPRERIHVVGNTIAEAFLHHQADRDASGVLRDNALEPSQYVCFTVHKPETLARLPWVTGLLRRLGERHQVIFPVHPRTMKAFADAGIDPASLPGVRVIGPQPYAAIGALIENSRAVVTDSSGLQEESTIAGVRCATVSDRTARPETVMCGTNTIVGYDIERCLAAVARPLHRLTRPQYWDRGVSDRIVTAMRTVMTDPAMAPAWVAEAREARDWVA